MVKFEIDLQNLIAAQDVYLGIEANYIEIAFLTDSAKLDLLRGLLID